MGVEITDRDHAHQPLFVVEHGQMADLLTFDHGPRIAQLCFGVAARDLFGHHQLDADFTGVQTLSDHTLKNNVLTMITCTQGSIQVLGEDDLVVAAPSGVRTEELTNEQPEIWKSFGRELPEPWWDYKWDILMHEYVNWIAGGDPPEVRFENAMKATEIFMAGYLSAIRREKISLPLTGNLLELAEWPGNLLARLGEER